MSKLIIAKKGRIPIYVIILSILCIGIGIWMLCSGMTERHFGDSDFDEFTKKVVPMLIIMAGVVMFGSANGTAAKTFINVFDDRVEGVGLIGGKPQSFVFYAYQRYTLLKQGSQLCVFCNGIGYNIALTSEETDEILRLHRR